MPGGCRPSAIAAVPSLHRRRGSASTGRWTRRPRWFLITVAFNQEKRLLGDRGHGSGTELPIVHFRYATGRDHILAHPRLGEAGIHHIRLTILKEYCPTSTLGERLNEHNLSRILEFRQDVHANIFDATSLTKAKKIATQLARPNINTRQLNQTPSVRSTIGHKNSVTTLLYAAIIQKSRKVRAEVSIVTDILRADRREDDRRAGATTPDRRQAAQSHERQEHGGIPSGTITAYRLPALVTQKPS